MNKFIKTNNALSTLIVAALFLGFIPTVSDAGSWNGWIYQDPYPTSNNLYAVKFVTPKKGWIAGEQGTILYTEDGGDTWEHQESGTERIIKSLFFVNERQGWAVGGESATRVKGVIIHTNDGGKTWIQQDGDFNLPLNGLFFLNDKEGWIVGNEGILLHTTDGGKKWERQVIDTRRSIASVYFISSQVGWLLAGDRVYRTVDGGKKWDEARLDLRLPAHGRFGTGSFELVPPEWSWGELYFFNEKKGWVVTGFSPIYFTNDGGKTWTNRFPVKVMAYDLRHISFSDDKNGCATGSNIVCTEDSGKTWKERLTKLSVKINDINYLELHGISFVNKSGWTVGINGQIRKTEDGGKTWQMAARTNDCGRNSFFIDKNTGWVHGLWSAYICRTDDGGHSFQRQETGLSVFGVFFVNKTLGWAAGEIEENSGAVTKGWGIIRQTKDGGKTWKTQFKKFMGGSENFRFQGGFFNLFFLNDRIGWVVGQRGTIIHTVDGGEHWELQKSDDPISQLRAVQFIDSKTGWIAGIKSREGEWSGVVLHTTDGGIHWEAQYTARGVGLHNVAFNDNNNGWATGATEWGEVSMVFHTTDGGKTWTETDLGQVGMIYPAFNDSRGVLISEKGWPAITEDRGVTWKKPRRILSKYPWHFSDLFEKKK